MAPPLYLKGLNVVIIQCAYFPNWEHLFEIAIFNRESYLAEQFRQITHYLVEQFRQITHYLVEQFRQIAHYLAEHINQKHDILFDEKFLALLMHVCM